MTMRDTVAEAAMTGAVGGESLVILPGLLCDSRMFRRQTEAFGGIVIDGFYGKADRMAAMAEYALERLPARCALLGHSMGARVALEVWRRHPERVGRLALADTGIHPVADGEQAKRYSLRDLGRRGGAQALVDAWLPPMVGAGARGDSELMMALREMAISAGQEVYEAQIEALLHRPDPAKVLAKIDCPVLVVVGKDDVWSPPAQHRVIAAAIPGARLRIVDDAGHMAPAEQPDRFNELLREWLAWPVTSGRSIGQL